MPIPDGGLFPDPEPESTAGHARWRSFRQKGWCGGLWIKEDGTTKYDGMGQEVLDRLRPYYAEVKLFERFTASHLNA